MNLKQQLLAIGILLAVSSGYVVNSCRASLVSVAESYLNETSSSAKPVQPARDPVPPKQFDVPFYPTMMDTSMSGSNSISASGSVSILVANSIFEMLESCSGKVYLLSWMWLLGPPLDDLLKVPISNS